MPPLGDAPLLLTNTFGRLGPTPSPTDPTAPWEGSDAATVAGAGGLRHPVPHLGVNLRQGVVHAFSAYPEGNDITRNWNLSLIHI